MQTLDQVFHTARFKLEDRRGFRALQHVEAFFIVQRNGGDIQRWLAILRPPLVDHLQRPVDDSQRTQTEEVELHQPGIFHVAFIKLGNRMLALFIAVQRRKVGNFGRRDDHAASVLTGVTRDAFELTRHIDQRSDLFIRLVNFR
ncbi:Uncharacterised protein [Salmonella enterica subsp. enterica serovar Typhi]|nr:Uncharacterised protein [Salmonella enterica subsp. enterica serovar Typhi]